MSESKTATAYAVQMEDGPYVGIWREREIAERICEKQPPSHRDRVVEMVSASDLAAALAERDALAARVEQAEKERDEWSAKWQTVRRELAELKYPGMTGVVRANDAALSREEKS